VPRVRLPRLVFVCLLIASTAAQHRVYSQSATTQKPAEQPTFRVGATYVRVDTSVTKDGKPVTDLTADDFEIFEDGVKQTIRNFELVSIQTPFTSTAPRRDPQTVAAMREAVADPRRRVFVLFLDTYHIRQGSAMWARTAFQRFLERIVGPDDLIAGMTPEMSPEALTFGSRTEALNSFLDTVWGRRDSLQRDPEEDVIQMCYGQKPGSGTEMNKLAPKLIERRRSKLSLDALEELVHRVGGMRDERKAIITVTEGIELFTDDLKLAEDPRTTDSYRPIHTGPVYVPPPGTRDTSAMSSNAGECDKVRLELANMETAKQFRDLPDVANRVNVSFYYIDPRGLAASDDLLNAPSPSADIGALRGKLDAMRELAERTDGMALYHSNDLNMELTRIAQDLSSYYLLGYDSTNGKLDGSYRTLSVKVKRPGVLVRARRGYRAAILPSAGSSNSRTGAATSTASPSETDITNAVSGIMGTRGDLPVRLRATAIRLLPTSSNANGSTGPTSELRLVAEVEARLAASDAWRQGGTAHFIIKGEGTDQPLSADATLTPGSRILTTNVTLPESAPAGPYHVQMRLTAQTRADALSDATTVQVTAPGLIAPPALLKRGPSTGTAFVPTADVRFRRADRLRLEAPSRLAASQVRVTAVDQRGQPLNLPIQVTDRQEGAGAVIVADITLAPLAPAGYAIVLATTDERVIVPFQVIP
jgi:VWFA-related protein